MHEEKLTSGDSPKAALLTGAALLGGAALLATPKAARAVSPALTFADIPGSGDIKVLNYALALEALEADLYGQALQRLGRGGRNALGQTINGLNVSSSDAFFTYLEVFGRVERQHREFLNTALGANSILRTALKDAKFDFNINSYSERSLLEFLIGVEATGVRAYIGAIPSFTNGSPFLTTASAILGTEARHTAALIVVKNRKYGTTDPTAPIYTDNDGRDKFDEPNTVLAGVSPFIVLPS